MQNQIVQKNNNSLINFNELEGYINLARLMSTSKVTIPQHLRNEGDCLAIVMQSIQWGLNPFLVAPKTYIINGVLAYEAQLVAAVINKNAPIIHRLNYEYIGDWSKVIGNTKEKTSREGNVYRVNASTPADEKGCGVIISATIVGEEKPRELTLLFAQVTVRNSKLWAEDPKQQLGYLAAKKWARLHCPDIILGVYTVDEVQQMVGKNSIEDTIDEEIQDVTIVDDTPLPQPKETHMVGKNSIEDTIDEEIQDVTIVDDTPLPQPKETHTQNDDSSVTKGPSPAVKLFAYIKSKGLLDMELLGNFVTEELKLTKQDVEGINLILSDLTKLDQLIIEFVSRPFNKLYSFVKSKGIQRSMDINSFINDMLGVIKEDSEEINEIMNNPDSLNLLINEFKQLEGITEFQEEKANLFNHLKD